MKANLLFLATFKRFFPAIIAGVAGFAASAQNNYQSLTYQTAFTGNSGNSPQSLSFPKFNPSLGTLGAVVVKRKVSINYGFTLVNQMSSQATYSISVGRWDNISSSALSSPLNNTTTVDLGSYTLKSGASVTKAPYIILYRYLSSDSITSNVVNFMGTDDVTFTYSPRTYTMMTGGNIYSYQATAADTVQFSITYIYTQNLLLASGISNFSAKKAGDYTAALSWQAVNEQPGCRFEIYKSTDGIHFTNAGAVAGNQSGAYAFSYPAAAGENGRLWFRVATVQNGSATGYSEVRMVDMTAAGGAGFSLYPNPSSHYITLNFNTPGTGNWQTEVYAANGSLLQQDKFYQSASLRVNFRNAMPPGVYFIRAVNLQRQETLTERFMVK